jgi:predicted enzyme related to lactoylglutathione lyase
MPKIIHFEIPVDDPARASAFYSGALGWEISGYGDEPYWLVRAGAPDEPGADGALIARGDLHRSPVLIAGVADVRAALDRVRAAGGEVVSEPAAVPGMGWAAYVRDTEGNVVGLFQPDESAGP